MRHIQICVNAAALNASGSTRRIAGFSDGWYSAEGGTTYGLSDADRNLINARAALLPNTDVIVAARVKYVDVWGRSAGRMRPTRLSIIGGQTSLPDDPRMCLQYSTYAFDRSNELQLYIQHVPDARTTRGVYVPTDTWENGVRDYMKYIVDGGYGFMGYDNSLPKHPIETISETGLVTCSAGHGYTVGTYVRILDTKRDDNKSYRNNPNGHYITATATTLTFQLQNWTYGACTGGSVTQWSKVLCSPRLSEDDLKSPEVATRKVGKPFFQYRGRASKVS